MNDEKEVIAVDPKAINHIDIKRKSNDLKHDLDLVRKAALKDSAKVYNNNLKKVFDD